MLAYVVKLTAWVYAISMLIRIKLPCAKRCSLKKY